MLNLLYCKDLTILPSELSQLINLKQLILNNCNILDISPITKLVNLEELNIASNKITDDE